MRHKNRPKNFFQPFVFVLKEGKKIQDNPLDYSLMLMQFTRPEIIKSPMKQGSVKK